MYLVPNEGLNARRRDHPPEEHDQEAGVAATLKAKCKEAVARTIRSDRAVMPTRLVHEQSTAFTFMPKGMTLRSIEEIEMFARVRRVTR